MTYQCYRTTISGMATWEFQVRCRSAFTLSGFSLVFALRKKSIESSKAVARPPQDPTNTPAPAAKLTIFFMTVFELSCFDKVHPDLIDPDHLNAGDMLRSDLAGIRYLLKESGLSLACYVSDGLQLSASGHGCYHSALCVLTQSTVERQPLGLELHDRHGSPAICHWTMVQAWTPDEGIIIFLLPLLPPTHLAFPIFVKIL
jgi:hypothetical protein